MQKVFIHADEINLKKKNRPYFEKMLIENLKKLTPLYNIHKDFGFFIADFKADPIPYLKNIPGIYSFAIAEELPLDIELWKKKALELTGDKKWNNFAIITKRHDKNFPLKSPKINQIVGTFVHENTGLPANLKKPELDIRIEITPKNAYIYANGHFGIGGLPVGGTGSTLCLLSGGIDSPVAAYMLMKRGTKVHFIHFLNSTEVTLAVKDKIIDLVTHLNKFQGHAKLYIVPFMDLQWEIIGKIEDRFRMLVYRRYMLKIANRVAGENRISALITGDSLAQVASQTLENLRNVYEASELPIFHPLIAFNKLETIRLAEKIGTMEISSRPYDDCCTFYVPRHPATKSKMRIIQLQEKDLDEEKLINMALDKMEIIGIQPKLAFKKK